MAKEFPRGKLIDPQEVADVAAFLCSPRASGMSGHIVTVDAGFASRGYPPPQAGTN
jgi:enoyl-[acyl-carrier-protein] reductase (NADH)